MMARGRVNCPPGRSPMREAALELGVKRIVVGECGHAWRVAYSFWNTLVGIGAGGRDPFARETKLALWRLLEDDVNTVEQLLGRRLDAWRQGYSVPETSEVF